MRKLLLLVTLSLTILATKAQIARDVAVELSSRFVSPNKLYLHWRQDTNATKYYIYKRVAAKTDWVLVDSAKGKDTGWLDLSLFAGKSVEYRVAKWHKLYSGWPGNGYMLSGYNMPPKDKLGKVILLIDSNYSVPLKKEIAAYKSQLIREGWEIIPSVIDRNTSVTTIKSWIKNEWNKDSLNLKCIFILGHVPVPYSGNMNPDAHPEHRGAWPADMYYGNFSLNWTDNTANTGSNPTAPARNETKNVPGDGKFDQIRLNSSTAVFPNVIYTQIPVGRVDLYNMPSFGNDTLLTKRYLNKALKFRSGLITPVNRGLVDDNFGYFYSEAFASGGFRNISVHSRDSLYEGDFFTDMKKKSYLLSYGCGAGTYTSASGVGSSVDYANDSLLNPFTMLFGSYFGDWDNADNLLRAPLASRGWGLGSVWSGRSYWMLHETGLGNPLYSSVLNTLNCVGIYNAAGYQSYVHMALMGDPTLRFYNVREAANITIAPSCTKSPVISWTKPLDNADSMVIEEKIAGVWKRVKAVAAADTFAKLTFTVGSHNIGIRSLKLLSSASGTWWQYGARVERTISINVPASAIALASKKSICTYDSIQVAQFSLGGGPKFYRSWFVDQVLQKDTAKDLVIKNMTAGTHKLVMMLTTDSSCVSKDSFSFTVNALPDASFMSTYGFSICQGKLNDLMSHESSLRHKWYVNNQLVDTTATYSKTYDSVGTFAIEHYAITSQGCQAMSSNTLKVNAKPNASFGITGKNMVCLGDSIWADAIGDKLPSSFHKYTSGTWSAIDQKVLLPSNNVGQFSVLHLVRTVYGCEDTLSASYTVNPRPAKPVFTVLKDASNLGDTLVISISPKTNNFQLFGETTSTTDSIVRWVVANKDTAFAVNWKAIYTTSKGCSSDTGSFIKSFKPSSVESFDFELTVMPNPSNGITYLSSLVPLQNLKLMDASGKEIAIQWVANESNKSGNYYVIDVSGLSSGIYYLQANSAFGKSNITKLVVQK